MLNTVGHIAHKSVVKQCIGILKHHLALQHLGKLVVSVADISAEMNGNSTLVRYLNKISLGFLISGEHIIYVKRLAVLCVIFVYGDDGLPYLIGGNDCFCRHEQTGAKIHDLRSYTCGKHLKWHRSARARIRVYVIIGRNRRIVI